MGEKEIKHLLKLMLRVTEYLMSVEELRCQSGSGPLNIAYLDYAKSCLEEAKEIEGKILES